MPERMEFVGRETELQLIGTLIGEWNTRRVLCVEGEGGIGKTRLLEEVYRRYSANPQQPLLLANIVDFDDRAFHQADNIGRQIATSLGETDFGAFLFSLMERHKIEDSEAAQAVMETINLQVRQTFTENFNRISTKFRIIVLFDTTEKLEPEAWTYLVGLIAEAKNALFILAGRNAHLQSENLKEAVGPENVQLIDLPPLEPKFGSQYLAIRQRQMHITLDPDLAQKLLFLAKGRPILLDLAVEWLSRNIPLEWLTRESLESLKALPDEIKKELRQDFEIQLVRHIAQLRTNMDRLTLVMSRVYPLTAAMIETWLSLSPADAEALFNSARDYVFVKTLPDGRLVLHDVMRAMVREYVWPEVDPTRDRRRRDSALAVDYLTAEIRTLTDRYQACEAEEAAARQASNTQAELKAFVDRERTGRELWALREQLVYHSLYVDPAKGFETFIKIFDKATLFYNFSFRRILLDMVQQSKAINSLSPQNLYELDSRRVKYLLDAGEYDDASALATKILGADFLSTEQRIDMLIQRGNLEIRRGKLQQGLEDCDQAVFLSQGPTQQEWRHRALNARGWAYRNLGELDAALKDYLEAYEISLRFDDLRREAWLLNNIGYVHALKGNRQEGLEHCLAALDLWEKDGFGRGLGSTLSALGEIHRRYNEPDEALKYYTRALKIFSGEKDYEWESIVRSQRASLFWSLGRLAEAEDELALAQRFSPGQLKPRILHTQAEILVAKGDLKAAREKFYECHSLSRKMGDRLNQYKSFVNLANLAWENGEYDHWRQFNTDHAEYADRLGEVDLRLRASALRRIADLAICEGEYDTALPMYAEGFALAAQYEIHEPFKLKTQLAQTEDRLRQKAPERLSQLGQDLQRFWKKEPKLAARSPEALRVFIRWETGRAERKTA